MNEDYLWDKTGEDAEIEKLENALQAFRFRETAPPALTANVLPFRKKPSHRIFAFAMAAAACVAFAAFGLVVWLQVSNNKTVVGENLAETTVQQSSTVLPDVVTVEKPNGSIVEKIQNSKPSFEQKVVKVRQIVPTVVRQREVNAQVSKNTKPAVRLTKEEKYAYNQLMLALSITSSKLKMVKDKVEGLE